MPPPPQRTRDFAPQRTRDFALSPDEIARFQALVKPAVVLLLMLRLDRPAGPRELADLLGLDEHTVAKYLRTLTHLNLVARSGYHGGYVLLGGRQLIFGEALRQAGIGEPKRSQLCGLPHLTLQGVRTWESQLMHDKGSRYATGLLVYVLESGDPPPPANANGHILSCDCSECQYLKYRLCPYCDAYPCQCPD